MVSIPSGPGIPERYTTVLHDSTSRRQHRPDSAPRGTRACYATAGTGAPSGTNSLGPVRRRPSRPRHVDPRTVGPQRCLLLPVVLERLPLVPGEESAVGPDD